MRNVTGGGLTAALKALRGAEGWKDDAKYWDIGLLLPVAGALCQRPAAMARPDFIHVFAEWPLWEAVEDAKARRKARLSAGLASLNTRELLESALVDWIDKRFPVRVSAAPVEKLTRSEAMARIGKLGVA